MTIKDFCSLYTLFISTQQWFIIYSYSVTENVIRESIGFKLDITQVLFPSSKVSVSCVCHRKSRLLAFKTFTKNIYIYFQHIVFVTTITFIKHSD